MENSVQHRQVLREIFGLKKELRAVRRKRKKKQKKRQLHDVRFQKLRPTGRYSQDDKKQRLPLSFSIRGLPTTANTAIFGLVAADKIPGVRKEGTGGRRVTHFRKHGRGAR